MAQQEATTSSLSKVIFALAIVAIIAALVFAVRAGKNADDITGTFEDPTKGADDALVVVEEYSDFQCPACEQARTTLEEIVGQFDGQAKLVYNDYPLTSIHPNAMEAAIVGQCADRQGAFWPVHDALFDTQAEWSSSPDPTDRFVELATEAGVEDADAFRTCVENQDTLAEVDEDIREGESREISGTPTVFVNGERFVGGSYSLLLEMVAEAVADEYGDAAILPAEPTEEASTDDDGTDEGTTEEDAS